MNPYFLIFLIGAGIVAFTGGSKVKPDLPHTPAPLAIPYSIAIANMDSVWVLGGEIILRAIVEIKNFTGENTFVKEPILKLTYNNSVIGKSETDTPNTLVKGNDFKKFYATVSLTLTELPVLTAAILNKTKSNDSILLETESLIKGVKYKASKTFKIADLILLVKL